MDHSENSATQASVVHEFDRLSSWLDRLQASQRVPGWTLVLSDREHTLGVHCAGIANATSRRPITPDLRWQIGSVSKVFSAIAVVQLARAGQLELSDPVREHLPWAEHLRPDVTIHHLLSHTGGVTGGLEGYPDSRFETATLGLLGNPRPPGKGFHYSNSGYEAVGDIIETRTGRPLEVVLEQQILGPLGMHQARGSVRSGGRDQEVSGHTPRWDDRPWRRDHDQVPEIWYPTNTADGAITATPEDLACHLRFIMNGNPEVLDPDDFALLKQRHAQSGEHEWYGYGLRTDETANGETCGHSGGMVGTFTDVTVDVERGIGTALVVNGYGDPGTANRYILDCLRAVIDGRPAPKEPVFEQVQEIVDDESNSLYDAHAGLYRAINPWLPAYRVARQDGRLYLVEPIVGNKAELLPRSDGAFGLADAAPELLRFGMLVEGEYLELDVSGARYVRARRDPA